MMREDNKNIDQFFADRLASNETPPADWNMPSDDIWLAAKEQFIQEEKPKRRIIFWLFGCALIAVSLICINAALASKHITQSPVADGGSLQQKPKQTQIILAPQETLNINETIVPLEDNPTKEVAPNTDSNTKFFDPNATATLNRNSATIARTEVPQTTRSKTNKGQTVSTPALNSTEIVLESFTKGSATTKERNNNNNAKKNDQERGLLSIAQLQTIVGGIQPVSGILRAEKNIVPAHTIIPVLPQSEIGISHSKFLLGLLIHAVVYSLEDGSASNVEFSINSLNLNRRNWLSKKISISYGVNTSLLRMNADVELLDTLERDISEFISNKYNSNTRGSVDPETIQVELKDGFELVQGDIVTAKGNVTINVLAVQFPVMVDHHVYKNNWEFLLGAGASLDLLWHNQKEIDISLFKSNQLINEPLIIEGDKDFQIDYSIYAGFSTRYHLNDSWNIGISTNIDVLEPTFSHVQFGLYHRWHKK